MSCDRSFGWAWASGLLVVSMLVAPAVRAQDETEDDASEEESYERFAEDGEAFGEEVVVASDPADEERIAEPVFEGPHFRFGIGLSTEAILGSTLGAIASVHLALGVRATESLSFLLRISGPDIGVWARNGMVDLLAGAAVTLGIEHLGLNKLGDGRGVAFAFGLGAWFVDERLITGGLGTMPYASLRVLFLLEHQQAEVLPLFSPTMGITAGAGFDPDTGAFVMRLGLVILGIELSAR